ncbi:MAG: hypothetical protein JSS10_06030 [Verrucomicrobia bacterium]|nr:hypothetical protein [Verrucomicrobiota bacterium]
MALVVKKENAPQTLRVIRDPSPSPILNLSLMRNLFTPAERLTLFYYPVLAWNECVTFSGLTLSFSKDPDLARIIQSLNKLALRTLPDEEMQARLLQDARKILEPQITYQVDIQTQISSGKTRREHERILGQLKKQAWIAYFNQGGRETRQKIDEALLQAAQQDNPQNLMCLKLYWEVSATNEWGAEWHQSLEATIYRVLNQALEKGSSRIASMQQPLFRQRCGFLTQRALELAVQETVEQWKATPQNKSLYCGDPTKLNYMLLKGSLWKIPLMRSCQKQILQPLIDKTRHDIITLAREHEKTIQSEVAGLLEELHSPACCIDRQGVEAQFGFSASEKMIAARIKVNQEQRKRCLDALQPLQAHTFETHFAWACRQWNYDTQEMQSALDEETPYDRDVLEVLRLTGVTEDRDLYNQEMGLDLKSLPDPIAYFVEQYKRRDEEALALFNKVTVLASDPIPPVATAT